MTQVNYVVDLECQTNGVAVLRMQKQRSLNSLDDRLLAELLRKLIEVENNDAIKVVILTGVDRGFSSGADLSGGLLKENADELSEFIRKAANPVVEHMRSMSKVIVAAVNGVAAGAGVSLVLACDIAISAASARYFFSFAKIGMAMDMGMSWMLNRRIGSMRTAALTMSAGHLDAKTAQQWGLVYEVVPDADLMERALEFSSQISSHSCLALKALKSQINFATTATLSEAMYYEALIQGELVKTEQAQQLIKAFIQR